MRNFIDNKLVIASNNNGKIIEIREILKGFNLNVLSNINFKICEANGNIWICRFYLIADELGVNTESKLT